MAVTAKFVTDRIDVLPNVATALTLRLYSDDATSRSVTLVPSGELAEHMTLGQGSATLETNQIVDVPVTFLVPSTIEAGTHLLMVDVQVTSGASAPSATDDTPVEIGLGAPVVATATIDVESHTAYAIELLPTDSKGSSTGNHLIRLTNTGNTAVAIGLSAGEVDDAVSVTMAQTEHALPPGASNQTSLRVTPSNTFWNGPSINHQFTVSAAVSDGHVEELLGTYEQRPRVPAWFGPAAAGALAALVLGAIIWFAFLRPWVEDTADEAAADAIELDRAAQLERIEELEELPLGTPTDIRLDVDPAAGNVDQDTASAQTGTVLSVTDVVFQNPTGAVGTVTWLRGDEVLLRSELANFRDFDLHFVAPYQFDDRDEIVLEVDCRTPGPGQTTCPVGASLVGFVD